MWDSFVERRHFKFQNEIQFSSNTIMKQLKHDESDSFFVDAIKVDFTKSWIILLALQIFANVMA